MNKIDKQNIWHPFTQEKNANNNINIMRGRGVYLIDNKGEKYIDLISSWWCNLHGHCNKEIAFAISKQAKKLEHVMFAGFTHNKAIELIAKLQNITPNYITKYFFSDNGSTSVEIALKMAYQYYKNQNISKNKFISFNGAYHGDTLFAMNVSCRNGYHKTFQEFYKNVEFFKYPTTKVDELKTLEELDNYTKTNDDICALIIEPLIQGASGMNFTSIEFLNKLVDLCNKKNIFVIFDEVMTGFYRTGKMFACDYLEKENKIDFLCLSKAITGGFLPLSVTCTTNDVYQAFYSNDTTKTFLHGHTYTANPIACAAACKTIEILQRKKTLDNIKNISQFLQENFSKLQKYHFINNIRTLGNIAAFELNEKYIKNFIQKMLLQKIILRPLGNTIYWLPQYCCEIKILKKCFEQMCEVLDKLEE